jgi:hypothetical protein
MKITVRIIKQFRILSLYVLQLMIFNEHVFEMKKTKDLKQCIKARSLTL